MPGLFVCIAPTRADLLISIGKRQNLTIRDLYRHIAGGSCHDPPHGQAAPCG